MKKTPLPLFIFCILIILLPAISYSQYIVNGNARQEACNCYILSDSSQFQSGSVWQRTKNNLNSSFDFSFKVYLGCKDDGADGIAFILETDSNSVGFSGEGLGFEGISPSIGISLDTYENLGNDPPFDHMSIQPVGSKDFFNKKYEFRLGWIFKRPEV